MPSLAHQALAALAVPSQHARLIRLDAPVQELVVEGFEGTEAVCAPFRFQVDVLSTSAFIATGELLGRRLSLHLARADGSPRSWHGLCTAVAPLGGDGGLARYRLLLEPWTALLTHRRNALVFQDLDALGVLEQLFADYPLADWRFDVTRRLPERPITTQYRESDWEFATRLLSEAGLAWRYEHAQGGDGDDGDGPRHALVVFDQQAEPPEGRALRFHRIDATGRDDALSAFSVRHQVVPSRSQVGSWHREQITVVTGVAEADAGGTPALEAYAQPSDGRFYSVDDAHAEAGFRLDALRLPRRLFHAAGGVRDLRAGARYTLRQHPVHDGAAFVPVSIVHAAANNLGAGISALLGSPGLERGSYHNRFAAAPADTPIAPHPRDRPTAYGPQTARVVGLPDAAITSNRDHQVRIQFAWARPRADSVLDGREDVHEQWSTWVPVAEWLAGPNWGSHFLPRIGAEVLVEFAHGDIDQPRIIGQLYNGEVAPPFAGGVDARSNHPGTLSGLHSQSHDGEGTQQWVIDDTPGQLRTRLHTTLADSRLELGYLIDHGDDTRGGLRGEGFELSTAAWGNVRAGQGLLISTTARTGATSTQLDVAEAVAQLKGAERTAESLHDTLRQRQLPGFAGNDRLSALRKSIDPDEQAQDTVERFVDPKLIAESPESIAFATPASAVACAGGTLHMTAQQDVQLSAGQAISSISGQHVALYAHSGPLRVIAANGPLSLQAHTGELELLADQSVGVTSTDGRIDVLAAEKIVLRAGQARVTLEGGDITFECPGNFTIKAAQHPFLGGSSAAATLAPLPDSRIQRYDEGFILKDEATGDPLPNVRYRILRADGSHEYGVTDREGRTHVVSSADVEDLVLEVVDE